MKKARLLIAAVVTAGALLLTACSSGGSDSYSNVTKVPYSEGTTMAKLAKAGTITIGTKFDQPLFGLKGPNGVPEGFDVEIGKIIAANLGIPADKIKWTESVSANREPFIQNGQVDAVIATYTINDKRKQVVSFAGPYYMAGQSILVKDSDTTIKSEKDLVGKPVCSVTGSTPAKKLAEIGAVPVLTDTYSNCLEPLRTGKVVAVSTDNVILAGLAAQNKGEFKVVGTPFTQEPYGIGVKLEDTAFRKWINQVLEAAYKDGAYKKAWEKTAGTVLPYVAPPAINNY